MSDGLWDIPPVTYGAPAARVNDGDAVSVGVEMGSDGESGDAVAAAAARAGSVPAALVVPHTVGTAKMAGAPVASGWRKTLVAKRYARDKKELREGMREWVRTRKKRGDVVRVGIVDRTLMNLLESHAAASPALRDLRSCLRGGTSVLSFAAPCEVNNTEAQVIERALSVNSSRPRGRRITMIDLTNATRLPSSLRWLISAVDKGRVHDVIYPPFLSEMLLAAPPSSESANAICAELHILDEITARNRQSREVADLCRTANGIARRRLKAAKLEADRLSFELNEAQIAENIERRRIQSEYDEACRGLRGVLRDTLAAVFASPEYRFRCLVEQGQVVSAEHALRRAVGRSEWRSARRIVAEMLLNKFLIVADDVHEEEDFERASLEVTAQEATPAAIRWISPPSRPIEHSPKSSTDSNR